LEVRPEPIGFVAMNNPLRILQTLDKNLTKPADITIFGRAAIALGYARSPDSFSATKDVDAILPFTWLSAPDENVDFWLAQQHTNEELEPEGLYITHLFREQEIILTPEWLSQRVQILLGLTKLTVFRPATADLILTKMMRGDETDLNDIRFLLEREPIAPANLATTFAKARIPELPEIRVLFETAKSKVLEIARCLQN
jgi:hypothetical protein